MITDFYEAYYYLYHHPIFFFNPPNSKYSFSRFKSCLDIDVVKVNPITLAIDDNKELNTKIQIWLETGPCLKNGELSHDFDLDCGGDTFEEAVIKLANLVLQHYTSDKEEALKRVAENYY